jgi:signal transduction histidine kinase
MFNTLYRKMAAMLMLMVLLTGVIFYFLIGFAAEMYQQEVAQKLNVSLAKNIVSEQKLLTGSKINKSALENLFHDLMVINPSIEVYLLNPEGDVLAYSAPEGRVKKQNINLDVVNQFVNTDVRYPILGDDPRSLDGQKVFSAARIVNNDKLQGYLYVILSGEAYDSVIDRVKGSYILKLSTSLLLAAMVLVLVFGLVVFLIMTRRLRLLTNVMLEFRNARHSKSIRFPVKGKPGDEVEQLGLSFNKMADRIDEQVEALKATDAKRREMVANVSHDLRTPLTSLHGYIETLLLKKDVLSDEECEKYLNIANNQSKQLIDLVSELFELAKLDSSETILNIEPFSLKDLMQDVVQKFQLAAEKQHIELEMDVSTDIPFAYGDIGMIQRVLDNLIENAIRHTPESGKVSLSFLSNSDKISVKVADTGCGIPKDDLPNIFDRFYRLEKSRQPTKGNAGLGLAIVKRIMELHGSSIEADSKPNFGTTFTFHVPVYQTN